MVTIQIDEQTAKALESAAAGVGLSLSEYLKTLVVSPLSHSQESWDNLEREILELSVEGSLPISFSRADIYHYHD